MKHSVMIPEEQMQLSTTHPHDRCLQLLLVHPEDVLPAGPEGGRLHRQPLRRTLAALGHTLASMKTAGTAWPWASGVRAGSQIPVSE
jgi:hypothetical protein